MNRYEQDSVAIERLSFVFFRYQVYLLLLGATLSSRAADLRLESVKAWEAFVQSKEVALTQYDQQRSHGLLDLSPELRKRLQAGEILIRPVDKRGSVSVPGALIHDWLGTVFIPNTTLEAVLSNTRDYEQYARFYKPSVVSGKLRARGPNLDRYQLLLRQSVLTVKTGLDGDYRSEYHPIDSSHQYSITRSERLQEISSFGGDEQAEYPPGHGSGFIWRIYSSTMYEAADEGVYVQLEAAALSRPVPRSLGWLVTPVMEKIARSALTTTLRQTREASDLNSLTASGSNRTNLPTARSYRPPGT